MNICSLFVTAVSLTVAPPGFFDEACSFLPNRPAQAAAPIGTTATAGPSDSRLPARPLGPAVAVPGEFNQCPATPAYESQPVGNRNRSAPSFPPPMPRPLTRPWPSTPRPSR